MDDQPLHSKRIVITRAQKQADEFVTSLRALGAEPFICPAIAIIPPANLAPLDAAIARLHCYDWLIFTSANAVRMLLNRIAHVQHDITYLHNLKTGAVGTATVQALREYGFATTFTPSSATADAMVAEIGDLANQRVLFPCADIAREVLPQGLRARGALVDEVVAYHTVPDARVRILRAPLQRRTIDALMFFSPSAVRYVLDGLADERDEAQRLLATVPLFCIGPTTADAARAAHLRVAATAREHTSDGMIRALIDYFATH